MKAYAGAVLVAAGKGSRLKSKTRKARLVLAGSPLFAWSFKTLAQCPEIGEICLVAHPGDVRILQAWVRRQRFRVAVQVAAGGAQRQDSVANGARALKTGVEVVLVHDAARPFVSAKLVARCAKSALKQGSGIAAVRVKDTIKWARGNKVQSLPRQELWAAQTPQAANKSWYLKALARAGRSGAVFTDEAGLLEAAGFPVKLVQGEYENIKITTPEDLVTANMIAGKKSRRTV